MGFQETINKSLEEGEIPQKYYTICLNLYESYRGSLRADGHADDRDMAECDHIFETLLRLMKEQLKDPFQFKHYHKKVTEPYDYYRFGIDFVRPLVDTNRSSIHFMHNVDRIEKQLVEGENVILFANHQTEVDPQLISFFLEHSHPHIGQEIIFVAGDRVQTDPMAISFSMGRNLLCIYSKRHIDNPPEKKEMKLQHNQRTMNVMKEMLSHGGYCIYVAPGGGRDRPNEQGEVVVAQFDPSSIEMFRLMAKQADKPVHFYPLSLITFDILPPPPAIASELGEHRIAKREGAHFAFGDEIDMETFPGSNLTNRHEKRAARAQYIWNLVHANYMLLKQKQTQ